MPPLVSLRARTPLLLLGVATAWAPLVAGPLDPPAGPVTAVYKNLGEVEPRIPINATTTPGDSDSLFKITQSGSYYQTGNVTGAAAKSGVEIATSGVTIDLNGFDLDGVPDSVSGVVATVPGDTNIVVRNSCSGNTTNWVIAIGNVVASIVNGATNAAAINGNTYAGSVGSADPTANLTY